MNGLQARKLQIFRNLQEKHGLFSAGRRGDSANGTFFAFF